MQQMRELKAVGGGALRYSRVGFLFFFLFFLSPQDYVYREDMNYLVYQYQYQIISIIRITSSSHKKLKN
jgi:hypothetical protein